MAIANTFDSAGAIANQESEAMPMKRLGIDRPDFDGLTPEQMNYLNVLEVVALSGHSQAQDVRSSFDPRTWPPSTYIAVFGLIATAFLWAFNSGGQWQQVSGHLQTTDGRVQAVETRLTQAEATYARRDLLEQQMNYVVTGLNELKVKVDQLTAKQK